VIDAKKRGREDCLSMRRQRQSHGNECGIYESLKPKKSLSKYLHKSRSFHHSLVDFGDDDSPYVDAKTLLEKSSTYSGVGGSALIPVVGVGARQKRGSTQSQESNREEVELLVRYI